MADILLVSKPLQAPWNDGSKTLARDLALGMARHRPIVLGGPRSESELHLARGRVEPFYGGPGGHTLGRADALRLIARLLRPRGEALVHFFFQPNLRTSSTATWIRRVRRAPMVHTVSSAPELEQDVAALRALFFADRTVVLSRRTETRLLEAGVRGVVRIAPGISPLSAPSADERALARKSLGLPETAPLVVFPGDLERGEGATLLVEALAALPEVVLAIAARAKSARTAEHERRLRERAQRLGVSARALWIGETPRILDLLGAADLVALPSRDLGAKVDLPIVLIEAMWRARPVIVAEGSSAAELAEGGGAVAVPAEAGALVHAIRTALEDRDGGARARRAAEERYGASVMAARCEQVYDELLR